MGKIKLCFTGFIAVIMFFTGIGAAKALDDKWLYAGAFKVDSGSRCIFLATTEQIKECAKQSFSQEMAKDHNLDESMALMINTNPKSLRPCTTKEVADARLEELKDFELYGCLALKFEHAKIKVDEYFKNFTLLIIKFEQIQDYTLRISGVRPSRRQLALICEEFNWGDIEELVRPYLSEDLQTALTMQGKSSKYRVSAAAEQALNESMPEAVKKVLKAIIKADC